MCDRSRARGDCDHIRRSGHLPSRHLRLHAGSAEERLCRQRDRQRDGLELGQRVSGSGTSVAHCVELRARLKRKRLRGEHVGSGLLGDAVPGDVCDWSGDSHSATLRKWELNCRF